MLFLNREKLSPMFGDSFILLLNTTNQGIQSGSMYLWNWLITLITNIFKAVGGQIGSAFNFIPSFKLW